tara:strand:- start:692 stop:1657 length:966 start_codon:yes stop_codon:yes gene_type:complete
MNDLIDSATKAASNLVGAASSTIAGAGKALGNAFDSITSDLGVGKATRLANSDQLGKELGAIGKNKNSTETKAKFPLGTKKDWRVKLSIPNTEPFKNESHLIQPLRATNGLVFPYTPTVIMSHTANYNALAPTHSNYPFQVYANSQVDQLVITGDFFVQNGIEAQYWVSALHYLRSCTKMFYGGNGANQGAPPPVVKLNGYGDYVFDNVPVVITTFTVDMPDQVDYISTQVNTGSGQTFTPTDNRSSNKGFGPLTPEAEMDINPGQFFGNAEMKSQYYTWAPTQSLISVTCQPIYSRTEVDKFSLESFVNGQYVGRNKGFI